MLSGNVQVCPDCPVSWQGTRRAGWSEAWSGELRKPEVIRMSPRGHLCLILDGEVEEPVLEYDLKNCPEQKPIEFKVEALCSTGLSVDGQSRGWRQRRSYWWARWNLQLDVVPLTDTVPWPCACIHFLQHIKLLWTEWNLSLSVWAEKRIPRMMKISIVGIRLLVCYHDGWSVTKMAFSWLGTGPQNSTWMFSHSLPGSSAIFAGFVC